MAGTRPPRIPILFVGGLARSGTTLVQRILTRHSRVTGGPEIRGTQHLMALRKYMRDPQSGLAKGLYTEEQLDEAVVTFVYSLLQGLLEKKPAAVWISEKTTVNVFAARPLLNVFPGSRFVHVLRDPRDLMASTMKVRNRAREVGSSLELTPARTRHVAMQWEAALEVDRRLKDDPRYHLVRYEALVRNPEPVVRGLCTFLGLEFESSMLAVNQGESVSRFQDKLFHVPSELSREIDPGSIGRYRTDLDWARRAYLEARLGHQLSSFGFDSSPTVVLGRAAHLGAGVVKRVSRAIRRRL